ncbi:aspartate aminotransferase [Candidatus Woesearchaeota archaeon CG1_02_57_44]|nr:MAG: aspartate aminotransferase [Candidatus Woesearchaeota archaeon CG1_02_57_44]
MEHKLSDRAMLVKPSATLAITAKAKAMKAQGIDVIGFGAGEPDFDTPRHIKDAAKAAIDAGFTKYTPTPGIPELRAAIAEKLGRENGVNVTPEQVIVTAGGKQALYNTILALVNPKDQVLIPEPYWVSYVEMVNLAGGKPVIVKTTGFRPTAQKILAKINNKTKLLILCTASNPTGMLLTRDDIEAIAAVCKEKGIYVISDEIYEKLIYEGEHCSMASLPGMQDLVITINGVSKAYSMTGWRIGYAAGPKDIISAASRIQDHSTSGANSIAQKAALAAITGPQDEVARMKHEFKIRRDLICERLNRMRGVSIKKPQGAFYVFPNVSKLFNQKIPDSNALAAALLEEAKVAVVPGAAFGADKYIRMSYALSVENIIKGMDRMDEWIKKSYRTL